MSTLTINYDKRHDILYARDIDAGYSYGEEENDGTILYKDINTDILTGIAIYSISKKLNDNTFNLSALPIPLDGYSQKINAIVTMA